jgi:SNF2 family DNA or RNA helicase
MRDDAPVRLREPFYVLAEESDDIIGSLESGRRRFLISYDQLVKHQSAIAAFISRSVAHLIVDESHRMKAGINTLRGAALLRLGVLVSRRDILTGTPMPQSALDLKPQLDFLWPGTGLGLQIEQGTSPRDVIGPLYVRTTKQDLGLPPATRHPVFIQMGEAHRAFYSLVKSVSLQQLSGFRSSGQVDVARARNCVMRLLQVSSNPILAIHAMAGEVLPDQLNPLVRAVVEEGTSTKLLKAMELVRRISGEGRKTLVWTIFRENIGLLEAELADLNPVVIDGSVPTGSETDISTREGRIRHFHKASECLVMIANPAAASEGMSLHTICHDAIYVDRSYNATHYLQSLDRIHRLGIAPDTKTNAYLLFNQTPSGIGSIDYSVSRRLAKKIRQMQSALNDADLHEIALDEEAIPAPIDPAVTLEDLIDLVEELEGRLAFDPQRDVE